MIEWIEKDTTISEIEKLLNDGCEVEVYSPDGWVKVNSFVDKGIWTEYILEIEEDATKKVRCNENHLFETSLGWKKAKNIVGQKLKFLTVDGWKFGTVVTTGNDIPIVDIQVNHENHRYYTNGVSSHNTGGGKSLVMCHMAANYLMQNFNVLYITLEMAEERIAERIDSNLLNVPITEIKDFDKNSYFSKVKNLSSKTKGRLIVKEYPTASAHVGHFRYLLNELKEKKDFVPDVIVIDYLSICASERYKANANNMYLLNKAIAEELRGLAIEYNVPLITAGQVNRNGYNSSDLSLNDIAESFGIAMSSDLILGIITTEELDKEGKILMKQLKNRYNDPGKDKMFAVGIDRSRMKIYNVNDFEASIDEDVNVFDMSDFSSKMNNRKPSFKFEFGE